METEPGFNVAMPIVRTVLGDIIPGDLGVCYAHEHIIIDPSYPTANNPSFLLDSVSSGAEELSQFYRDGGRAMIDSMPCDAGRNILKLAEISRLSEVHIVAPTGLHLEQYYPEGHWGYSYTEEALARLFVLDIEEGIDAHDYRGPLVERTSHRAGLIKVASGRDRLTAHQEKVFAAASAAHRETGCPILTHTEQGTAALEQIDTFRNHGVDLEHVVLSHTDRKPDLHYHREILSAGVNVEYDSAFRWKNGQPNHTLDLTLALIGEFPDQIMLGMDAARRSYWKAYGGAPGLSFLLTHFSHDLGKNGLSRELWHQIFVANPSRAYSFLATTEKPISTSSPVAVEQPCQPLPPVSYESTIKPSSTP